MFILTDKKRCRKCGEWKPIAEFGKSKEGRRGLRAQCKQCRRNQYNQWRHEYPERANTAAKKYRAENKTKIRDAFHAWYKDNKEQVNERNRKWYAENFSQAQKRSKKWFAEHSVKAVLYTENRRALKKHNGGEVTDDEWKAILDKYGHRCLCCGRTDLKLTMDHVVPLNLGGLHAKENIQPLCKSCNSKKRMKCTDFRKS